MAGETIRITQLEPGHAPEVLAYWTEAHPLHPLDLPMLRERIFGPPTPDSDLLLAARDSQSRLIGLATGVYPCRKDGIGGIRWIGALPGPARNNILKQLLEPLTARLGARGAAELHLFATPPHYIRPGIDIRETDIIAFFLSLGWQHANTHFNMICDLARWRTPGEGSIFGIDPNGYSIRRAEVRDRVSLADFIEQHWSAGWRDATALAFFHDPITVFIAEKENQIVGFAAYEVDQCLGTFGPTGVAEPHRGHQLGQRLLHACLHDLKTRNLPECTIGWVGPVNFYHRACHAVLGPTYWLLTRKIE